MANEKDKNNPERSDIEASAPSNFLRYLRRKEGPLANGADTPEVPTQVSPLILEGVGENMEEVILKTRARYQALLGRLDHNGNRKLVLNGIGNQMDGKFQEFLISPDYNPEWLKKNTRKVFYDLETQYFPNDLWGVRDPMNPKPDQKVAACVSIDDQGDVKCWDDQTAPRLIPYLLDYDEVVAFNGYAHDNMVLSGYAPHPGDVQELFNKSFDLMRHMAFRETHRNQDPNYNRRDLNYYAEEYLRESKLKNQTINGSRNIIELIRNGSAEDRAWVWKYCFQDVLLLVKLYKRFKISMRKKAFFLHQQILDMERLAEECLKNRQA
jgi:hypothetical protein